MFNRILLRRIRPNAARARRPFVPRLESLEDRSCPSGGYLIVGSFDNNSVLRYSESSGAFVDQFDPHNLANLKNPTAGVFGSDGNLYVSSGVFNNPEVLQYNGTTGAFQTVFASQNITGPRGLLFGPDGNLYVADANGNTGGPASVERFDGKTGAFLNYFVSPSPSSNGGLVSSPSYMVFGPDGKKDGKLDLYVAAAHQGVIFRYDGTTGAFKGIFVSAGSGGLDAPAGMVFGADGNLYVASANWFISNNGPFYSGDFPAGAVLRFEGPSGKNPGAFMGTFIAGGSGGLANPSGILFGPDPSGNGKTDLYVTSSVLAGTGGVFIAEPGTSQVLRYDGTTGAFLGTFVTPDSGGLKNPFFLTFTETNPTTLNYEGTTTTTTVSTLLAQTASGAPISSTGIPAFISVALPQLAPSTTPAGAVRSAPLIASAAFSMPTLTGSPSSDDSMQWLWDAETAVVDRYVLSLDLESLARSLDDLASAPRN